MKKLILIFALISVQALAQTYVKCADQGDNCRFAGTRTVRYGAKTTWVSRSFVNGVKCSNSIFGDPLRGKDKWCEILQPDTGSDSPWVRCASQDKTCRLPSLANVRYGARGAFNVKLGVSGSIGCNNTVFGNPLSGTDKYCDYQLANVAPAPTPVSSYPVYPGCEAPSTTFQRTVVLDAAAGNTLQKYFESKQAQPGDRLVVKGQQGTLSVSKWNRPDLVGASKWIWIDAQGATFSQIKISDLGRILITKAVVESNSLPQYSHLIMLANTPQVVIADTEVRAVSDSSGWGLSQWLNAPGGVQADGGSCLSVIRNRIKNARSGVTVFTRATTNAGTSLRALIQDNELRNLSGDFLRPNGSDVTVRGNKGYDGYVSQAEGDGNHDDFIQSFNLNSAVVYNNIQLLDNTFQETTNVNRRWNSDYQGIGIFDGKYTNYVIRGNVLLGGAYHGIAVYIGQGGVIENNTVLSIRKAFDRKFWIYVPRKGKDGRTSSNIFVRNNVTNNVTMDAGTTGVTYANNFITTSSDAPLYFVKFSIPLSQYDLRPLPTAPFYGKGIGAR